MSYPVQVWVLSPMQLTESRHSMIGITFQESVLALDNENTTETF